MTQNSKILTTNQRFYCFWKRTIGIFGAFLAITLFGWLMLIILLINTFATGGHPIFAQKRVGKDGKDFTMLKFRSMTVSAPKNMTSEEIQDPNVYLTKFGKFLRKTSLDEWPQLFNIFIGQMAFIGPRPLINEGADAITIQERYENGSIQLRPGMSGLAQVMGRVQIDPAKKGNFDGEYFDKLSFGLDFKIFFLTIAKVFRHEGVTKEK